MAIKLGFLSVAHLHAESYLSACKHLPDIELVGIADEVEDRGRETAARYGTRYFRDYDELLSQDVDGVIICSENSKHAPLTRAAASAKKHVLCEKPIATSIAEGQSMIDACKSNGVQLQIAFPVRFNTPVLRARQMLQAGQIGRLLAMKGTNRGRMPGGWFVDPALSGGGAVIDHTVHVADIMRWLTGKEFTEVYAEIDRFIYDIPTEDCGILTMEMEGDIFCSLDTSWSRPARSFPTWGDVTLDLVGTEGVIQVDGFSQNVDFYNEAIGKLEWLPWGDDGDLELVKDFADMIRTGRLASITGEDGLRAVEVAFAAYESAKRKKPVKVAEIRSMR